MMTKIIFVGSDPEMFTQTPSGIITSVAGRLGCDKWNKRELHPDVRLQEDNVLAEFDINPHSEFEAFDENMQRGLDSIRQVLENELDCTIAEGVSSHIYTMEELESFDKSAFIFGCEPDFNALTGMQNPKPAAADAGLRTAGGHIHIGYAEHISKDQFSHSQAICGVMCDYFLGLPSLLLDKDDRRRELYGKAGSVRMKSYGIEYRTLSNFWVFSQMQRQFIWGQAHKAFEYTIGDYERLINLVDPEHVQQIINTGDKKMAEQYIKMLDIC